MKNRRKLKHEYFQIDFEPVEDYLIIVDITDDAEKTIKDIIIVKKPKLDLSFPRNPYLMN
ncbi:hypothetical protein [uncultured Draconibacterium sp.]|uniref:hypothetical protein n=1 Tax=uncultured Draconibacterium sp. TaxID=1573823 RepID=UPI0029C84E5D|nr:hypothetical protein [uncultured Draconibacterium sp.]